MTSKDVSRLASCPWGPNYLSEVYQCTDGCVWVGGRGVGSVCVSGDEMLKGPMYPRKPSMGLSVYEPSDTSLKDSDLFCPVYLTGRWLAGVFGKINQMPLREAALILPSGSAFCPAKPLSSTLT